MLDRNGKVKVSLTLGEAQIKEAIAEWLAQRGFEASTSFVNLYHSLGDRPGDIGSYSANISNILIPQPVALPATRPAPAAEGTE